jgi:type IV secretion system protein VirB9
MIKLFLATLILSLNVNAAIIPKQQNADSRVTVIAYSPDDVITVRTQVGISTLIQLEADESFASGTSGMGIGDIQAWGINVKGNNIFLKPIAENADTNLIIVSNKGRTYSFDLITNLSPHYIVKLQYDKPKSAKDFLPRIPCSDGEIIFGYKKWGDNELAPSHMWDDGRFTCLKFTNVNELPVIYQIGADGTESVVNYSIKKDTMIIHSISKEFRLRLGKQVLGLKSDNTISSGYNNKGSSVNATRELKHD